MNGHPQFTGFGAGADSGKSGITPGKVWYYGAMAQAGWELGRWLAFQQDRFEVWKNRGSRVTEPSSADADDQAATVMFMAWDGLIELRDWMATVGDPVENWEGDLRTNIRAVQYVERTFPEAFALWKARNYGGRAAVDDRRGELLAAITSLGWSLQQAERAADQVQRVCGPDASLSEMLKEALISLLNIRRG